MCDSEQNRKVNQCINDIQLIEARNRTYIFQQRHVSFGVRISLINCLHVELMVLMRRPVSIVLASDERPLDKEYLPVER